MIKTEMMWSYFLKAVILKCNELLLKVMIPNTAENQEGHLRIWISRINSTSSSCRWQMSVCCTLRRFYLSWIRVLVFLTRLNVHMFMCIWCEIFWSYDQRECERDQQSDRLLMWQVHVRVELSRWHLMTFHCCLRIVSLSVTHLNISTDVGLYVRNQSEQWSIFKKKSCFVSLRI